MSISRKEKMIALREQYKDLLGLPWTGRRIYGCYEIIRKYYKYKYDDDLPDFNARGIITFTDEAIEEGGAEKLWESEWGEVTDWSGLQVDDVILFRLYVNPLGGSYSAPRGAAPNHGGIYLGDGFMLHHPYNSTSMIADLEKEGNRIWNTSCIGAIRKKST